MKYIDNVALYIVIFLIYLVLWGRLESNPTCDLVIARYNEDLKWLSQIRRSKFDKIYVYNKGRPGFRPPLKGCITVDLPNVGREAHTYINHVIANYGKLGDVTVFLPGSCDMPTKWETAKTVMKKAVETADTAFAMHAEYDDVREVFYNFTVDDYQSLNESNRKANPESELLKSPDRPFGEWYEKNFGRHVIKGVSYFGIFAASRKDIRKRSLRSYINLIGYLNTHSSPEVAHYLERSWPAVFSHAHPSSHWN